MHLRSKRKAVCPAGPASLTNLPVFTDITAPDALAYYAAHQILHVRVPLALPMTPPQCLALLTHQFAAHPASFESNWSVENRGNQPITSLSASAVLKDPQSVQPKPTEVEDRTFYVSCILQQNPSLVESFLKAVPLAAPSFFTHPVWNGVTHSAPLWLFFGSQLWHFLFGRATRTYRQRAAHGHLALPVVWPKAMDGKASE